MVAVCQEHCAALGVLREEIPPARLRNWAPKPIPMECLSLPGKDGCFLRSPYTGQNSSGREVVLTQVRVYMNCVRATEGWTRAGSAPHTGGQ